VSSLFRCVLTVAVSRGQCGHGVCAGERKPRLIEALLESNLASDRFGEHAEGFGMALTHVIRVQLNVHMELLMA
jgi:hypothetical protein